MLFGTSEIPLKGKSHYDNLPNLVIDMSGSQLLRTAVGIPIYLARQVEVKDQVVAFLLIESLDQNVKDSTAEKVGSALEGNKMLTEDVKKNVKEVEIT